MCKKVKMFNIPRDTVKVCRGWDLIILNLMIEFPLPIKPSNKLTNCESPNLFNVIDRICIYLFHLLRNRIWFKEKPVHKSLAFLLRSLGKAIKYSRRLRFSAAAARSLYPSIYPQHFYKSITTGEINHGILTDAQTHRGTQSAEQNRAESIWAECFLIAAAALAEWVRSRDFLISLWFVSRTDDRDVSAQQIEFRPACLSSPRSR